MAQDSNEGVAYLVALKQGVSANAGSSSTAGQNPGRPQATVPTDPGERFQGAEKRRSVRYKCEGSAEIRKDGCEVRTFAAFTDISLHGCYVEAQATYPPGTALELKLEANEFRVETKGVVRVTYPYLGMGISFEGMSEENIARLRQLVTGLSNRGVAIGGGGLASAGAGSSMADIPVISDPASAVQALIEFFTSRQALLREDFVRIVKGSQK